MKKDDKTVLCCICKKPMKINPIYGPIHHEPSFCQKNLLERIAKLEKLLIRSRKIIKVLLIRSKYKINLPKKGER